MSRSASRSAIPSPRTPSGAWVAAMTMPPRARWSRHQGGEQRPVRRHRAPRSARPAARSAAARPTAARSRAAAAGPPTDRPPADARRDRARPAARLWPGVEAVAAEKIPPERQVLQHAQRRLHGVAVAEIMGLFGKRQFRLAALEIDRSAGQRQQARDQPQQRGFAGSVGAGDGQRLARRDLEIEAREHLPAASHASDAASREPHFALPSPLESCGYAANLWVPHCCGSDCRCGGATGKILKGSISRNLMQHTIRALQAIRASLADGAIDTLAGYNDKLGFLT